MKPSHFLGRGWNGEAEPRAMVGLQQAPTRMGSEALLLALWGQTEWGDRRMGWKGGCLELGVLELHGPKLRKKAPGSTHHPQEICLPAQAQIHAC